MNLQSKLGSIRFIILGSKVESILKSLIHLVFDFGQGKGMNWAKSRLVGGLLSDFDC